MTDLKIGPKCEFMLIKIFKDKMIRTITVSMNIF